MTLLRSVPRAVAFIDGQNLFYAAKEAFGYTYPNYDPIALARAVCDGRLWRLIQVRFYTGVPDPVDHPRWHQFWTAKLAVLGSRGVATYARPLRYRNQTIRLPDGSNTSILVGQEKGIDIRLALDAVRLAREALLDVAVIFSQDQDLSELADELVAIAREQKRPIHVVSAFPLSPASKNRRGINRTEWIRIPRVTYDACLDPRDYRPRA